MSTYFEKITTTLTVSLTVRIPGFFYDSRKQSGNFGKIGQNMSTYFEKITRFI